MLGQTRTCVHQVGAVNQLKNETSKLVCSSLTMSIVASVIVPAHVEALEDPIPEDSDSEEEDGRPWAIR
jgi:hypothetical protein